MLKVVVFDGGWGGELVANYLESELNIINVVRVIDWKNKYYDNKTTDDLFQIVEPILREYIGQCDLIVLGGHTVSLILTRLRQKYPNQSFVGMEEDITKSVRLGNRIFHRVAVLANNGVINDDLMQELTRQFPEARLCFLDCSDWEGLIDSNGFTKELLYARLKKHFKLRNLKLEEPAPHIETVPLGVRLRLEKSRNQNEYSIESAVNKFADMGKVARKFEKCIADDAMRGANGVTLPPDLVIMLNTHYWELKSELEEIFGWRTRVIDMREALLHDVCVALKLLGLDGKRNK